jgi:hypothetical protein
LSVIEVNLKYFGLVNEKIRPVICADFHTADPVIYQMQTLRTSAISVIP